MKDIDLKLLYRKTIEVLKLAAASADLQLKQFPKETCRPDEVALTFDEVICKADLLLKGNLITKSLYGKLKALNEFYSSFKMGEGGDWTEHAMYASSNWEQSRQLAKNILADMDIQNYIPDLFWIRYVY